MFLWILSQDYPVLWIGCYVSSCRPLIQICSFIDLKHLYFAKLVPEIFLKEVVRFHGFPYLVVSDQDPPFLSLFWFELFHLQGTQLKIHRSTIRQRFWIEPQKLVFDVSLQSNQNNAENGWLGQNIIIIPASLQQWEWFPSRLFMAVFYLLFSNIFQERLK